MPKEKITPTEARQATVRPRAMVLVLFASLFWNCFPPVRGFSMRITRARIVSVRLELRTASQKKADMKKPRTGATGLLRSPALGGSLRGLECDQDSQRGASACGICHTPDYHAD